jgi:ComF family protein
MKNETAEKGKSRQSREYIDPVFKTLLKPALHLKALLPTMASQCAVCHSWPAAQVCTPCIARFSPTRRRCTACALALAPGLPAGSKINAGLCADCSRHHPAVDATLVATDYAYPWSELITRYKFGKRPGWAPFFAELLMAVPQVKPALDALQTGDLMLPMPLSAERLKSRGFNQAWELACALHACAGSAATLDAHLLLRVKNTRPQTELQREARLANVKGAFQVDPLRQPLLTGRRVLLVDDVMTSGASLFTAATVLRAAGATHITAVTIARTPAP